MARFDWYQATIPAPLNDVLDVLSGLDESGHLKHERGAHGYAHATVLMGLDGPLARVWHGGSHEYPHAVLSGENAQAGAELIRASFPEHFVTRVDPCEDFGDDHAFDRTQVVMLKAAQAHRVKVDTRGDHLLTMQGRTLYLGAASSACRLRLYDKAAELRSKFAADPERLARVPDHLTRLEAQVRPQTRESRASFATIEPLEVMGSSKWLREVWKAVAGLDLQPVQVGKGWRQSDDERAYRYLLAQYGGVLRRMVADHGDWPSVGLQLGADLAAFDLAKRKGR